MKIISAFAASLVLIASLQTARAEPLELSYNAVVHLSHEQHINVAWEEGRRVGIAAFRGIAIFESGDIANYRYEGSYDFLGGNGTFRGYSIWQFDDGSQITSSYTGEALGTGDGIEFAGTNANVAGTGRFENMTGSGTFEGRRVDNLDDGGDTIWTGLLTLDTE